MISVAEARELLIQHLPMPKAETLLLDKALGRTLSQDILSPIHHPIFDQTAVDGYALHASDLALGSVFRIGQTLQAGTPSTEALQPGLAARIFTGAPIPPETAAVIMQEHVETVGGKLTVQDPHLKAGANIRRQGEQIQAGQVAMRRGEGLNATGIGFLASLGIASVAVGKQPHLDILVTGNEFAQSLTEGESGKIFESNGVMLQSALAENGWQAPSRIIPDDLAMLTAAIDAFRGDVLLVTGGVSVGDFDFTRPALEAVGYEVIFHRVNQKPGKPILFARKGDQFAFGLPGNPRSVMVGWHEYVRPFLRGWVGMDHIFPPSMRMPMARPLRNKPGKTTFLAATVGSDGVAVLDRQGSHMLRTLAEAHCLVVLHPDRGDVATGEYVDIHWIA